MPPAWVPSARRVFGAESLSHASLEYSDTNEDVEVSLQTLDVQPGQVVVGVTASGDTLLLALRNNPAFVAGYDLNPAQNALAELKRVAMGSLTYDEYLALLGYRVSASRTALLRRILPALPDDVRAFWLREDMTRAVEQGLWRQGSATRKDLDRWEKELRRLADHLEDGEMSIVLGLSGSREDRARIQARVARSLPQYAEPAFRNNNHFKFDPFQYPDGMVNHAASAKYAAPFLPEDRVSPALSREDFERIRPNLHRACFQTSSMGDALALMPEEAFHRLYLSNITEYLTVSDERALVELMLEKACPDGVVVLLFLALSPAQQRDLLDHSTWSERGLARLIRLSSLQQRDLTTPARALASKVTGALDHFARGGAEDAAGRVRRAWETLDRERLVALAQTRGASVVERVRGADYAEAGRSSLRFAQRVYGQALDRWKETEQLSQHDFVLLENTARTAAFHSDIYANLRATNASRSFYGFDY
ncbi:MAG: hypothetical protein CVU63_05220, partial [Deltaproteobacteria bacterium HGW-Deltaproteobacteria-20]